MKAKKAAKTKNTKNKTFRELLEKYLEIKGLDIVVILKDGREVELYKHREIIDDIIVAMDKSKKTQEIPIKDVKSVDMFAA